MPRGQRTRSRQRDSDRLQNGSQHPDELQRFRLLYNRHHRTQGQRILPSSVYNGGASAYRLAKAGCISRGGHW